MAWIVWQIILPGKLRPAIRDLQTEDYVLHPYNSLFVVEQAPSLVMHSNLDGY